MNTLSLPSSKTRRALGAAGLCLALSACGGGGGNASTPSAAVNNVPRFAYVANLDNTVSIYTVNAVTGQLRANGYAVAGTSPVAVATDPLNRYAYVVNLDSNDVSAYAIDARTGTLTRVGPAVTAGTAPRSVSVHPSGRYAYVANEGSDDISAYVISASNGALLQINCAAGVGCNGANFAAGSSPFPVIIDPAGRFAYAVNAGSNDISAYTINAATGALTPIPCGGAAGCNGANFAAGTNPFGIAIDPAGRFVYVTNVNGNTVSTYGINASTGALTGIDPAVVTGTFPVFVAVDPSGRFAYVTNQGSHDVSAYRIDAASGALTPIECSTGFGCNGVNFAAGDTPITVAMDPSGRFAYVVNSGTFSGSFDVFVYAIDATTGALTRRATVRTRGTGGANAATAIALTRGTTPVTYTPAFAYAANSNTDDVSAYTINAASGGLVPVNNGAGFTAGTSPRSVAVDPSGRFAYVANQGSHDVSAYRIDATSGALTQVACATAANCNGANFMAGTEPRSIAVDPSGRFVYVANQSSGDVSAFEIDTATGALTNSKVPVTAGSGPRSVTVDPTGRFAYAANFNAGNVSAYTIDASDGTLLQIDCGGGTGCNGANFAAGSNPVSVSVETSGRYAYVVNEGADSVSIFAIAPVTGALEPPGGTAAAVGTGTRPRSIAIDPSGRFAYVANADSNSVSAYSVDGDTGALVRIDCVTGCNDMNFSAGPNPLSVAVDPSGGFAYVANFLSDDVWIYTIDPASGGLIGAGTAATGTGPFAVTTTGTIR